MSRTKAEGAMSRVRSAVRRGRRDFWTLRHTPDDSGMTLVELVVVLVVISIVMTLSTTLIINANQQTTDMLDTVKGIESQTGAEEAFINFLRGSTEILTVNNSAGAQVAPSTSELDIVVNDGFNTSDATSNWGQTQPYQSNCTNVDAIDWTPSSPAGADAQFSVSADIPSTGMPNMSPWSNVAALGPAPYTYSPKSPCAPPVASGANPPLIHSISNYYALSNQPDPAFTYWAWQSSLSTTLPAPPAALEVPPGLVQLPVNGSNVLPACAVQDIAAVGVHVTFLAGPQTPHEGFAADQPTTLNTLIFLIGSSTSGATTSTTTTSSTVACTY